MPPPVRPSSFVRQPFDEILGSVGAVRLLRALVRHGGALSVTRLADEALMSPNGARKILYHLERAGIVLGLGASHVRIFSLDVAHPLGKALVALFEAEKSRFEVALSCIRDVTALPEIAAVWLFGSVARHEDRLESDLDIALFIEGSVEQVRVVADKVRDQLDLHEALRGLVLSVIPMGLSDLSMLVHDGAQLWRDLLTDAVILKGPSPRRMAEGLGLEPREGVEI